MDDDEVSEVDNDETVVDADAPIDEGAGGEAVDVAAESVSDGVGVDEDAESVSDGVGVDEDAGGEAGTDLDASVPEPPSPETGEALLDAIAPTGLTALRVSDPGATAAEAGEALDADVVRPGDELRTAVRERLEQLRDRAHAGRAIAEFDANRTRAPRRLNVIADTDSLRELAASMRRAESLVVRARDEMRVRLGAQATGEVAVHPDSIRAAAKDVTDARARLSAATDALETIEGEWAQALAADAPREEEDDEDDEDDDPFDARSSEMDGADLFGAAGDEAAQAKLDKRRFGFDDGEDLPEHLRPDAGTPTRRILLVVVGTCLLAALSVAMGVNPALGVIVPAIAIGWAYSEWTLRRRDLADKRSAADNLATMSAIADQAYGGESPALETPEEPASDDGVAAVEPPDAVAESPEPGSPPEPPELLHARTRLTSAEQQLARATNDWEALVGPDADVDDLDSVLRLRDAQFEVTDTLIDATPTARAAAGFERRLWAKWKVAWAAADRPVPALDDAEAAIDALEADDIHVVSVERWTGDDGDTPPAQESDEDEATLRSQASAPIRPLVIVDEINDLTREAAEELCFGVAGATAVVLVGAAQVAVPQDG